MKLCKEFEFGDCLIVRQLYCWVVGQGPTKSWIQPAVSQSLRCFFFLGGGGAAHHSVGYAPASYLFYHASYISKCQAQSSGL